MILSVSSSHKTFNCKKVMEKLLECGIEVNIIENYTIVRKNNKSYSEIGCKIEFIDNPDIQYLKKNIWLPLKKEFGFDCAHLYVENKLNDCIYNI